MRQTKLFGLLFLILIVLGNNNCFGFKSFVANKKDAKEVRLDAPKSSAGILHTPAIRLVTAFILDDTLTINFTSSTPAATITISNQLTGEVEYTEICNTQSTVIDLSMLAFDGGGTYTIEVSTANWKRVGLDYN